MSLFNIYRSMLHSLSEADDYHFVFAGLARLLNNIPQADNTYLPYSTKKVGCFQEILVLLWKFLDENNGFLSYVLSARANVNQLVVPMMYLMWSGRLQPSKVRGVCPLTPATVILPQRVIL